jgi:hypothetical protein
MSDLRAEYVEMQESFQILDVEMWSMTELREIRQHLQRRMSESGWVKGHPFQSIRDDSRRLTRFVLMEGPIKECRHWQRVWRAAEKVDELRCRPKPSLRSRMLQGLLSLIFGKPTRKR